MDYPEFWNLVESTRGQPERAEALAALLEQHDPADIVRFRLLYDDLIHTANKVDLWGAGHTINGSCSDDEFYYFREALIELGREVFEAAVKDPDSLAAIAQPGEPLQGTEGLGDAPLNAWVAKTGQTEEQFFEAVDAIDARTDRGNPEEGEWWQFNDPKEVRYRLPRLAEKFLEAGGE
jgi:hypothetical protein